MRQRNRGSYEGYYLANNFPEISPQNYAKKKHYNVQFIQLYERSKIKQFRYQTEDLSAANNDDLNEQALSQYSRSKSIIQHQNSCGSEWLQIVLHSYLRCENLSLTKQWQCKQISNINRDNWKIQFGQCERRYYITFS